jgi:serine/threonine protein kinase
VDGATNGYRRGKELGRGSFGVVYEATSLTTGAKYALKVSAYDKYSEYIAEWPVFL